MEMSHVVGEGLFGQGEHRKNLAPFVSHYILITHSGLKYLVQAFVNLALLFECGAQGKEG